jgi:quinoprotein relay system zinc metallohydrolase 1
MRWLYWLLITCPLASAGSLSYDLEARQIAQGTFVFEGANEDFSFDNGGNITNIGVIATGDGAVVINTGPSRLFGEALRESIWALTGEPVVQIYISKLHPDHFLGNQAFSGTPIGALDGTINLIRTQGDAFAANMYRMVGDWMRGTEVYLPTQVVEPGSVTIGDHDLELIELAGHTPADLVVYDRTTGVLFAGGVVFHNRAPTTPHSNLSAWQQSLEKLRSMDFRILVPSHGPISYDASPIDQTRAYIDWLDQTIRSAASNGLDMAEVLLLEPPEPFAAMAVMPVEFHRSVSHLYPDYEKATLRLVSEDRK